MARYGCLNDTGLCKNVHAGNIGKYTWGPGVRDENKFGTEFFVKTQWCWGCGCCRICCRWQHADGGGLSHGQTACKPASQGRGKGGSYVWSFMRLEIPAPPNNLLKQEGVQLAETSFRNWLAGKNKQHMGIWPYILEYETICCRCPIFWTNPNGGICNWWIQNKSLFGPKTLFFGGVAIQNIYSKNMQKNWPCTQDVLQNIQIIRFCLVDQTNWVLAHRWTRPCDFHGAISHSGACHFGISMVKYG